MWRARASRREDPRKQTTWTCEDDDDEGGWEGTLAGRTQARTARTRGRPPRLCRTEAAGMAPGGGLGSGEDPSDLGQQERGEDGQRPFCIPR